MSVFEITAFWLVRILNKRFSPKLRKIYTRNTSRGAHKKGDSEASALLASP